MCNFGWTWFLKLGLLASFAQWLWHSDGMLQICRIYKNSLSWFDDDVCKNDSLYMILRWAMEHECITYFLQHTFVHSPISPWYKLQKFTKWYHWEGLFESYIIGKLKISRFQIQLIAVSNFQRKCSSEYFSKMADNRWKITKEKQMISFLHNCPSIVKPLHSRPP